MKNNLFADNKTGKGSKGFYSALGISAVMIAAACVFAYDQGEKLTQKGLAPQTSIAAPEAAVDHKVTDVPKQTTTIVYTKAPAVTTAAPVVTTMPAATIPAAAIIVEDEAPAEPAAAEPESAEVNANVSLENVKPPLADISNVLAPFSGGELVKNETTGSWQTHNGVDIAAEVGTEVFAVSNGEITEVKNDPLWGVTVIINHHNGYLTRYCGLADDLSVQQGDQVVSGDLIGVVGMTADVESALAPHLHIEMRRSGKYIDPMSELT